MKNKKPIILCTRALIETRSVVNKAYANAIKNAGGTLIMLTGDCDEQDIDDLISHVDGILLTGGTDVNPALYEEEKKEYTGDSDNSRDIIESYLIESAMRKNLPILAICRGIQIVNVKLGGSLYQDVEKEMQNSLKHDRHSDGPRSLLSHAVHLTKDSLIERILNKTEIEVNSLHHQGIKTLANRLVATAKSTDGLIEGVEMLGYPFLLGVQWHPEELEDLVWKNLFNSFVEACKK